MKEDYKIAKNKCQELHELLLVDLGRACQFIHSNLHMHYINRLFQAYLQPMLQLICHGRNNIWNTKIGCVHLFAKRSQIAYRNFQYEMFHLRPCHVPLALQKGPGHLSYIIIEKSQPPDSSLPGSPLHQVCTLKLQKIQNKVHVSWISET